MEKINGSIHLVYVDDEPDSGALFRQRFRREIRQGRLVLHIATSGAEALQAMENLHEFSPLLVLSDINMPEMDGLELLDRLKNLYPSLKVGLVSAYLGGTEFDARASAVGAEPIISKPIDFDRLKAYIFALED